MLDIRNLNEIDKIKTFEDLQFLNLTFEQAYEYLEAIVSLQRADKIPLQEGIIYYKLGVLLSKYCSEILQKANLEIEEISQD
jgi:exodeoxyribonuclease VII small subunit